MLSRWPTGRRIAFTTVLCLAVALTVAVLLQGLSPPRLAARARGARDRARLRRRRGARDRPDRVQARRLPGPRGRGGVRAARDPLGGARAREPRRRARRGRVHGARPVQPGRLRGRSCARRSTTCPTCCSRRCDRVPVVDLRQGPQGTAPTGSTRATRSPATTTTTGSSSSATRCCATSGTTPTCCARRSRAPSATSWRTTSAPTSWACELGVGPPMMIVMTPDAGEREIAAVRAKLETTGVHVLVMPGELTTAIGAIGDPEGVRELGLEGMPGVDRVVPISRPYKLASLELAHDAPTTFDVNGRARRRQRDVLPDRRAVHGRDARADARGRAHGQGRRAPRCCAAARSSRARRRSRSRASACRRWRSSPRRARRPGCRSSPSSWTPHHADAIAEYADVVQIGARNMQNYALLEVAGKLGKPVLLKRGLSSSLDELLMAADYVLKEGNERVMLCERGIRTFETATRFTLDLSRGAVAEAALAPAGDRRPRPRLGRPAPGRAAGARRGRGRRGRHHRRGPPGPRRPRCATGRRRSTGATSRSSPRASRPTRASTAARIA